MFAPDHTIVMDNKYFKNENSRTGIVTYWVY